MRACRGAEADLDSGSTPRYASRSRRDALSLVRAPERGSHRAPGPPACPAAPRSRRRDLGPTSPTTFTLAPCWATLLGAPAPSRRDAAGLATHPPRVAGDPLSRRRSSPPTIDDDTRSRQCARYPRLLPMGRRRRSRDRRRLVKHSHSALSRVAREGIEPPTRGFSASASGCASSAPLRGEVLEFCRGLLHRLLYAERSVIAAEAQSRLQPHSGDARMPSPQLNW